MKMLVRNAIRCALAMAGTCPAIPALQSDSFGSPVVIADGVGHVTCSALEDMDGDGDLDVLAGRYLTGPALDGGSIVLYKNDGAGTFGVGTEIAVGLRPPTSVASSNYLGDTGPDALAAWDDLGGVGIYENLGGASFGPNSLTPELADIPFAAMAADINGDQLQDIVVSTVAHIDWHAQQVDGTFGPGVTIASTALGIWVGPEVCISDIDFDGDIDIATSFPIVSAESPALFWHENDGLGNFDTKTLPWTYVEFQGGVRSIHSIDFDGDDVLDYVVAWHNKLGWFRQLSTGQFGPKSLLATELSSIGESAMTDFDQDGYQDIALAGGAGIEWRRNFMGTQLAPPEVVFQESVGTLLAGDINGDSFPDLLVSQDSLVKWIPNVLVDCDGNGTSDASEIAADPGIDCNLNQQLDICDIETMSSFDFDRDGTPDECSPPLLGSTSVETSISTGGTQDLLITAGPLPLLNVYLLLGTTSGTTPGTPFDGHTLPLNFDSYLLWTVGHPNTPPLTSSLGILPPTGIGSAAFTVPPATDPSFAGVTLNHAYVVWSLQGDATVKVVSNPVPLTLVP